MTDAGVSNTTDRLYAAAQLAFGAWCRTHSVRSPASHAAIADYLHECCRERGPSAVPVHLSAIARMYREAGRPLDTKNADIQAVVSIARRMMTDA
jgi:hypothetical protein